MNYQGIRSISIAYSTMYTLHGLHIKNVSCACSVQDAVPGRTTSNTADKNNSKSGKVTLFFKFMMSLHGMLQIWNCAFAPQKNVLQRPRIFVKYVFLDFILFCFIFHWIFLTSAMVVSIFVRNAFLQKFLSNVSCSGEWNT